MRTRSSLAVTAVLAVLTSLGCGGASLHNAPRAPSPVNAAKENTEAGSPAVPRIHDGYDLGPEELPDADLVRAMDAVTREASVDRPSVASVPWDHKTTPKYLDLVIERYGLTAVERSMLMKNGMVVLPRVTFPSYGFAMHEIHRQELPLYVTVDSLLQAVFRSHEELLVRAESSLANRLGGLIERIQKALLVDTKSKSPRYSAEVAKDADVYLGVARALLADGGSDPVSVLGQDAQIAEVAAKATAAARVETVDLFGRPRKVDFTFYEPRGVYLDHSELHAYFRAMVWLTRLELNVVSRGSRSSAPALTTEETPREATLALVLADLVDRAGATAEVAKVDAYQRKLAGKREDLSLAELSAIAKKKSISFLDSKVAQETLRAEIGNSHVRTVNYHVMPYGTSEGTLPVIATFFGTAITPDARSIASLVPSDGTPHVPRGPELAYLFGADAGARYVDPTGSLSLLKGARAELERNLQSSAPDLHSAWTVLVRSAVAKPVGRVPSFFETASYGDRRISTAIAGYAQIHHAHVLHSAQVYDFSGCTIPDAYVEPTLSTYEGTLTYTKRLEELAALLPTEDDETAKEARDAASRLGQVTNVLRTIARDELAGRPVSDKALAFLRMVAEYVPAGGGYEASHPGRYNGFYPYMHADRGTAFKNVPFSIDHFTSTRLGQIAFVGEGRPALGVFIVDAGGEPRAMVGPVTRAYDRIRPLGKRKDEGETGEVGNVLDVPSLAAHEKSYVAPLSTGPAVPEFTVSADTEGARITTKQTLRNVTIELVDSHGTTVSQVVVKEVHPPKTESDEPALFPFPATAKSKDASGFRIRLASGEVHSLDYLGTWPSPY